MPFTLPDPKKPIFSIETESLGRIDGFHLTVGEMETVHKSSTSVDFMAYLIATTGRKHNGERITEEEVRGLSDSETNEFAAKFLEHNKYLSRKQKAERKQDENGRTIVSYRDGEVSKPKREKESDAEYLFRLFQEYDKEWQEQMQKMIEPYKDILDSHKRLFTPSFLEAFKHSQSATYQLSETLNRIRGGLPGSFELSGIRPELDQLFPSSVEARPAMPEVHLPELHIPPNPIYETNEKLSEVVDRLGAMEGLFVQTAETVNSVSKSASEFLISFGAASDKADTTSRRAIWLAGLAVAVAVTSTLIQIGYSEWKASRDRTATEAVLARIFDRIDGVAVVQRESAKELADGLNGGNEAIAESLRRLSAAMESLAESVRSRATEAAPSQETP